MVRKLKRLETELSTSRKVLCWGRFMDVLYTSQQTISLPDPTLRVTLTLSRIASSLYLLTDHIVWLGRVGLVKVDRAKWSDLSMRCWLYSLLMNLVRDLHEVKRILGLRDSLYGSSAYHGLHRMDSPKRSRLPPELEALKAWILANRAVSLDIVKNGADIWLPLTALGHIRLPPAVVGLLGVISSSAAILQILDYSYRLSPS
jgi:peroxin-11B